MIEFVNLRMLSSITKYIVVRGTVRERKMLQIGRPCLHAVLMMNFKVVPTEMDFRYYHLHKYDNCYIFIIYLIPSNFEKDFF